MTKHCWRTVGSAAAATLWSVCLAVSVDAQIREPVRRPNIVLFIADDLGAGDIRPYGDRVVRTPNLERLAGESLLFTRAFAASPTCSPSRASIYTALMPFRHGAHANHTFVRPNVRSMAHHFGELGYRVAIAGKLHVGPQEVFPFERVAASNVPEPGFEGQGVLYTDLSIPAVDRWLAGVGRERPFFLVVADHSPHVAWPERPEYDPASIEVPPYHIDTPEYRSARTRYYTDVTKLDGNVGKLLEALARRGLAENTVVVFTADQGPQLAFGKWGLYDLGVRAPLLVRWPGVVKPGRTSALVSLVDLVPTLYEGVSGRSLAGVDGRSFLRVLRDAGAPHRDVVFASHTGDRAMNRTPMRMARTDRFKYILNVVDTIYTTHMDRVTRDADGGYWQSWRDRSFSDPHAAMVLWRYHHRPPEELYDLQRDPLETRNLAAEPAHAATLTSLRDRLSAWRRDQGDAETTSEVLVKDPPPGPPYIF